jgi:hypothetical protein
MMTAVPFILSWYALGVIPFPNRYVTWFEQSNPAKMTARCKGTIPNATAYHLSNANLSKRKYGLLHPNNVVLA